MIATADKIQNLIELVGQSNYIEINFAQFQSSATLECDITV